jgi:ClpP class serine protease
MDAVFHEITQSLFLVAPGHAQSCFELAQLARQGNLDFKSWFNTYDDLKKCFSSQIVSAAKTFQGQLSIANYWELDNIQLPEGSIGVVPVYGPLYSWRTQEIQNMLESAAANPKIASVIMPVQSPGGSIIGIENAAKVVATYSKPIEVAIMGMCCSAAYWIASGAKKIWSTSKIDIIGSIGVMTTYADFIKYYEKEGIKVEDLYASSSTEKNHDHRTWSAGNSQPVTDTLDYIFNVFQDSVVKGRGLKPNNEAFKGNTFFPEKAAQLKLIDGEKPIQGILLNLSFPY